MIAPATKSRRMLVYRTEIDTEPYMVIVIPAEAYEQIQEARERDEAWGDAWRERDIGCCAAGWILGSCLAGLVFLL